MLRALRSAKCNFNNDVSLWSGVKRGRNNYRIKPEPVRTLIVLYLDDGVC